MRRLLILAVATTLAVLGHVPTASAEGRGQDGAAVVSTGPPTVRGQAVWGRTLTATPGTWDPAEVTVVYRWLRDGAPVRGAFHQTYRVGTRDLGHRLAVRVTATATDGSGATAQATSRPTVRAVKATLVSRGKPQLRGDARYGTTLVARPGRWSRTPQRVRYQWLRTGKPIRGAVGPRYAVRPEDVGRRLRAEVTVRREGHRPATARSKPIRAQHRVRANRTVTYSVTTNGRISADVAQFKRLVQQTYDDARGWRGKGVVFRPVGSGGSFTVVLAEASTLPSYSSVCSVEWSCRVGRNVIINQTRWQHASPAWNGAGESLRDYRHMVVNHETGHWLGKGHASCPRPGALAPVMQQQSKGTQGCRLNPWPTLAELS